MKKEFGSSFDKIKVVIEKVVSGEFPLNINEVIGLSIEVDDGLIALFENFRAQGGIHNSVGVPPWAFVCRIQLTRFVLNMLEISLLVNIEDLEFMKVLFERWLDIDKKTVPLFATDIVKMTSLKMAGSVRAAFDFVDKNYTAHSMQNNFEQGLFAEAKKRWENG